MENRTFAHEAKAMEFTIKSLYTEREYLKRRVEENNQATDKARLQTVEHFISIYEGY